MKILFINSGNAPDYQCDTVFHGLKMLFGVNVYQTTEYWYMFNDISDNDKKNLYGKGFTLYGLLPADLKHVLSDSEIKKRIKVRYFDYIIYGSIHRCSKYFNLVTKFYDRKKIIFIDGEDFPEVESWYVGKGIYFKRELNKKIPNVLSVCFGIPKCKVIDKIENKIKIQAYIVPGDISTYIYSKEIDYYNDYKTSWFGITQKKGGWDCLRHYEIMANGCIPYFMGLADCPEETMHLFPKKMVMETNRLFDEQNLNIEELELYANKILQWTIQNLTTESIAEYVISTSENFMFNKINDISVICRFKLFCKVRLPVFIKSIHDILGRRFSYIRMIYRKSKKINIKKTIKNTYFLMSNDIYDTRDELHKVKSELNEYNIKNRILVSKILQYFEAHLDLKTEFEKELSYLKETPNKIIFPYKQLKNLKFVLSGYDNNFLMPYIIHNEKKLFFPKTWTEDIAILTYKNFVENENLLGENYKAKSPHQYESEKINVKKEDVVFDIGAAEGLFALHVIEKAQKIYLVEPNFIWIEALQATFAPYMDKVEIINKLISDVDTESSITLFSLLERETSSPLFIKMDIEGYETTVIRSSKNILNERLDLCFVCCTYHKQNDALELKELFESLHYEIEFSDGYMLFIEDELKPPYFRKGIIRAKK